MVAWKPQVTVILGGPGVLASQVRFITNIIFISTLSAPVADNLVSLGQSMGAIDLLGKKD